MLEGSKQTFFNPISPPSFHPALLGFFTLLKHYMHEINYSVLTCPHKSPNSYFMSNQPIPIQTANLMIADYFNYMTEHGVDMNRQTQSVSFNSSILLEWMTSVSDYADEFRIFMGLYPDSDPRAGRTTVIVWPYKDGQPATMPGTSGKDGGEGDGGEGHGIDPFNEGTLNP